VVACIPAYNEERTIGAVLVRTLRYVNRVVVCDDGSEDMTGLIARALGAVVVKHERNLGKGAALRSALRRVREMDADVVVLLDADGQHDPEGLPKIIEPIVRGNADMVVGSRYVGSSSIQAPLYRRFGLKLINTLSGWSSTSTVKDTQSS